MAVKNAEKAQQAAETAEVKNTTQAAEKAQEAPQEAQEQVTLVYVGPSLPKGRLKQNSIFVGTRQEIEKNWKQSWKVSRWLKICWCLCQSWQRQKTR